MTGDAQGLIRRFARNEAGRDYCVGDLHGCRDKFDAALRRIGFRKAVDRMFSTGDLGDRGAQSMACADLLYEPWFHAVSGNHERMAIEAADRPDSEAELTLIANGGQWFMKLSPVDRAEVARLYRALPLAIEVDTMAGKIGIVHAECPVADWSDMSAALTGHNAGAFADWCLWNRERITDANDAPVAGVLAIICGHTPVKAPVRLGNHLFIDTGAVYGHDLTIVELN